MALADLHYEEGIESVLRVQRTSKLRKPAMYLWRADFKGQASRELIFGSYRNISKLRKYLTQDSAQMLIHA